MQFRTRLTANRSLIDLTPLVDVIFLLLIFFMISSDVLPMRSLNVEHPTLDKESEPMTTQVVVAMDANHVVYLGTQKEMVDLYSLKELLLNRLHRIEQGSPGGHPSIVLSVDRRAEYGAFMRLFSIAQECGTTVRLVYAPVEPTTA